MYYQLFIMYNFVCPIYARRLFLLESLLCFLNLIHFPSFIILFWQWQLYSPNLPNAGENEKQLNKDTSKRKNSPHDDTRDWSCIQRLLRDLTWNLISAHRMFNGLKKEQNKVFQVTDTSPEPICVKVNALPSPTY